MGAFHAYDIRGIYNVDFDKETVYKTGYFLPELLGTDKVLVGRDCRISSDEIHDYLIKGITDAGADVYDLGLSTTPMVYFGTANYGFKASVQITASHNPAEYNGMKVSSENALPVGLDNGLGKIKEWIDEGRPCSPSGFAGISKDTLDGTGRGTVCRTGEENVAETRATVCKKGKGAVYQMNIREDYISFLLKNKYDYSGIRIAMDLSNGMATLFAKEIFGDSPVYIYDDMDGRFPNHEPNPLIPKNVEALQNLVIKTGADVGVIYDGDADRVMFVDEKGRFISPDLIIAVLGHWFLEKKGMKGIVLQDIRSSKAVGEYLVPMGAEMYTWKVGRAFAARKLRELDGVYGGELAGHYYFRDFFYSDSGLLASILVLNVVSQMKKEDITLSMLIERIAKYKNSGEINFKIEDKKAAMDAVRDYFTSRETPAAIMDFDGYRVEFSDWWFNIRPSNTEPYLRFICEAVSEKLLEEKVKTVRSILQGFGA